MMKFKTSAIALAVAGITATPMAAQADVYASARLGLVNTDVDGGTAELRVRSLASRFGAKGETDLGNGMSGFGKYEWDVDMEGGGSVGLRHRYVGVKGDFGKITIGQTYHTFYNHVVGPNDNPWWGSGYAMVSYTGRTGDAISFAGGSGAVSFGVTAYFIGDAEAAAAAGLPTDGTEEGLDGIEAGLTMGVGDMSLGLGLQSMEAVDNDVIGVALTGISAGDASIGVGFQQNDDDSSILVDAGFGSVYVHYEMLSLDAADADPTSLTVGYTKGLGPKTTTWYEFQNKDNDGTGADFTVIRAMLKYDIL